MSATARVFMLLVLAVALAPGRPALAAGSWTALARTAPGQVNLMLLLPDGTVMCANAGIAKTWCLLTPDVHGSYVNGTWSTLASMRDSRLYCSSTVLRDGRVFVAGGEYGTGGATAEVYSPLNNSWTVVSPPPELLDPVSHGFIDSECKILPNGNVLITPVLPNTFGGTLIYDPSANVWSAGPTLFRGFDQSEASWVKLPDDSILTIDPYGINSERYIPALNRWVDDGLVPEALYSNPFELGPGLLLADGRAFFLGGNGHTAFYTPSGTISPGTWAAGPDIPNGLGVCDGPAAMMVNGNVLCTAGDPNSFNPPTTFFEFDPAANAFTPASAPPGADAIAPYLNGMLDLPDGSVLYSGWTSQLYVYRPVGAPLAAGKPAIISIEPNSDGSFHLTGTLLNGISEGAAYGDDFQMNSNYPLVRMADSAGNVRYGRTFNWSSTGVMTGQAVTSTEFALPSGLSPTIYSLSVVANGISSDPVNFVPGPLPTLQCVIQPNGMISLSWTALAGYRYQPQFKSDLSQSSWSNLGASLTAAGSALTVLDTFDASAQRYYRVLVLP